MVIGTTGIIVMFVIGAVIGLLVFALFGGSSTITSALIPSAGGGILTAIVGVLTDAWQFLVSCLYGELSIGGYFFIGAVALTLVVWTVNALQDLKHNRPIGFVD